MKSDIPDTSSLLGKGPGGTPLEGPAWAGLCPVLLLTGFGALYV